MKSKLALAAIAVVISGSTIATSPGFAQSSYSRDRDYRGRSDRRVHCGSGNGAVGTVAGGVGGAVLGSAVGGGTLGTVAGGVGGALLGRHFDKKNTASKNRKNNGC